MPRISCRALSKIKAIHLLMAHRIKNTKQLKLIWLKRRMKPQLSRVSPHQWTIGDSVRSLRNPLKLVATIWRQMISTTKMWTQGATPRCMWRIGRWPIHLTLITTILGSNRYKISLSSRLRELIHLLVGLRSVPRTARHKYIGCLLSKISIRMMDKEGFISMRNLNKFKITSREVVSKTTE